MFVEKVNFLQRKNVVSEFSLGEIWQAADQAHTSEVFFFILKELNQSNQCCFKTQ